MGEGTMCFMKKSRRRRFFIHCPVCGRFLEKSEEEKTERRCKCGAKLNVGLMAGTLLIRFDSKYLRSSEFDGAPENDRRHQGMEAFLL